MPTNCNVCNELLHEPVFDSASEHSITSLGELCPGTTRVWFCPSCGHIQSDPLANLEAFYANDYKILLNHDEEDQVYEVIDGKITYRNDHQLVTLNKKITLKPDQIVLDYGCAKAAMTARLSAQVDGVDFHFFDVSDMYRSYWERLVAPKKCAVNMTPPDWDQKFDLVTSYFCLEHIPNPKKTVRHIASLLKHDGTFYAIVPDTLGNVADFVVVDHANHFTINSIVHLLADAGFRSINVDDQSHRGALVIVARKAGECSIAPPLSGLKTKTHELSRYWTNISSNIEKAEKVAAAPSAIYGSGFYGSFIYSQLKLKSAVRVVLDQNPYRQGNNLFGVPIVPPSGLPAEVKILYVGLNPRIARQVIDSQVHLKRDDLRIIFLDAF